MVVSERNVLLEAGAELGPGGLSPRGWGGDPRSSTFQNRRHVDGTGYSWVAVRRADLSNVILDPSEDKPAVIVGAVLKALAGSAGSVMYEPRWVVHAPAALAIPSSGTFCKRSERRAPSSGNRILVLPGALPRDELSSTDGFADRTINFLAESCDPNEITILATGSHLAKHRLAHYRATGLEVETGPTDLGQWFLERWGQFSHIVLSGASVQSSARHWIDEAQPQAAKILAFANLPFRDIESLRPLTPPDEVPGLDWVRTAMEARVALLARWADSIWCERADDVAFLRNFLADKQVVHLPLPSRPPDLPVPLPARTGLLLLASEGDDVVQANEDAAVRMLRDVVPWLRRHLPSLQVTVVSDQPSPLLGQVTEDSGAQIAPPSSARANLGSNRLVLVGHFFGTGGRWAINQALATGTPFLATSHATQGVDVGGLASRAVFSDPVDLRQQSLSLLTDDDRWRAHVALMGTTLTLSDGCPEGPRSALALLGITSLPTPNLPPACQPSPPAGYAPPSVTTRPHSFVHRAFSDDGGDDCHGETERYPRWNDRLGPTPEALQAIREDVADLSYQPLISIVMPVYNTDVLVLKDAIDSVRAQVYSNWQLCIADDGSSDPATRRLLDSLRDDAGISVLRLSGQSGISGASNAALSLADGEFVTFLDHDDVLKPHALAQVVRWLNADTDLDLLYSDEDKLDEAGRLIQPHLKPDWAPNQLMSQNYVCHLLVVRKSIVDHLGGLRPICDGSQDWDLVLRVTEITDRIAHIPEPLYSWRIVPGSAAAAADAKPYALTAAKIALGDALRRRQQDGTIEDGKVPGLFRTRYEIKGAPRVSIVIPTRDGVHLLRRCVTSIFEKSTYTNYDLVIIDNESTDPETLGYLAELPATILRYPHLFNYARMMNFAARSVECDALLFLNNDTEVRTAGWIEALLEHAMRPEVGAVGGRLYFGDGRLQHEGILVGVFGGWAANVDHGGYFARGDMVRDTSAVTGACTMMRPDVYWRVGGNDERLRVAYNDVDICLRVHQAGYQVVYTPYAELFHYESSTRSGYEHHEDGPLFGIRWRPKELVDPYYNPIFLRDTPFQIRT